MENGFLNRLKTVYSISEVDQFTVIEMEGDFPWRIKEKNGTFVVSKGFRDRKWDPIKYYQKKVCNSMPDCFEYIVNAHNRTAKLINEPWFPKI